MNREEVMLAKLANPYSDDKVKLDISLNERLLKFIDENKISLLLKEKGIETKIATQDEKKLKVLMNEMQELTDEFVAENVDYVLIKFPKLPRPHGDLDIIVSDVRTVEEILKRRGYFLDYDGDFYRRKYVKSGKTSWEVDIHLKAAWSRIIYLDEHEVLNTAIKRKILGRRVPVPNPNYELLITAAHAMRENKITLFDVIHAKSILNRRKINMNYVERIAKKYGWLDQFSLFIKTICNIYMELYENHNPKPEFKLPYRFPPQEILALKLRKALFDTKNHGLKRGFEDLRAYSIDILKFLKRVSK